jgi:arylsulfatase A-like enzyme
MSKAIVILFDSLNRHFLPPYGHPASAGIHTPNFERLAARSVQFNNSYVCSMPCMPARRDLHTGRPNFLHRAWGPLEPWDDSMPRMLHDGGIHSHLVTDHYHYFEEGGANYHTKYSTWESVRGQEGDPWHGLVGEPQMPDRVWNRDDFYAGQDVKNRILTSQPELHPQEVTFRLGREFIERNHAADNWMLQIETFDPHEPFFSLPEYKAFYAEHYARYRGRAFDWPPYREVRESPDEIAHIRAEYASLVSMCDAKLGQVLDLMDQHQMWDDTLLAVGTDHGFLLSEHDHWGKCWCPFTNEIARTPFFLWDPRSKRKGVTCEALVQPAIDLPVTLLEYFDQPVSADMTGKNLAGPAADGQAVREAGIFGMFGGHVNITDGRFVYMRGPSEPTNQPLFEYTLMPVRMRNPFALASFSEPLQSATFPFMKGCHAMKIPTGWEMPGKETALPDLSTRLYDLESDPGQQTPINHPEVEKRLLRLLRQCLEENQAPAEQFQRLGIPSP